MAQEPQLTEQLEEFVNLSKSDLASTKTQRLLDYLAYTEEWIVEELGYSKVDFDKLHSEDDAELIGLGEQVYMIIDILRERWDIPSEYWNEDLQDMQDKLDERTKGMQKAIDDLKDHRHEKQDVGKPTRDF